MPVQPKIPESIVIHLGAPDSDAANVTESFPNYIKNVASSEIFPTWPDEAIKANVLAQISVALNRVYTGYYRNSGKDFDITSSPAYDQTYIYQRDIYSNVSNIVDEIFDSYIRRQGSVEPLYAEFCDGVEVKCNGLEQWGSLALAEAGYDYEAILRSYYGDDIEIVRNVPVENVPDRIPAVPLSEGDSGRDVELLQIRLNRISRNYPGIPKITPVDGFFDSGTRAAVVKFQEVFGLTPDGIVGRATWNSINFIYNAVKKLSSVSSEGLTLDELDTVYPGELSEGMSSPGVFTLQYYLTYISLFVPSIISAVTDGAFGPGTRKSVESFQQTYGLSVTGAVDAVTWNSIESVYLSLLKSVPYEYSRGLILPFPGRVLRIGIDGNDVRALQEYLNFISETYSAIPRVTVDGSFGPATAAAVREFKTLFDIPGNPERVDALTWNAIISIYDDLYEGAIVNDEQFPGVGVG